jgi:shikimate kinase/3-dehydroquinate synthase
MTKTVFIGFMGAGKTTAARTAAAALGVRAADVDELLERRLGKPIARVFAEDGEGAFRAVEERLTLELLAREREPRILALGGGAVQSAAVREALRGQLVVWVDVDAATAWARVCGSGRPLARSRERFEALHAEREPLYAGLADVVLPAQRTAEAAAALAAYEGAPAGTRLLWAASASRDYPAYVGAGLLTERRFWPRTLAGRRFLVTDDGAGPRYGGLLEPLHARAAIAPGEQSKTLAQAERILGEMARAQLTRADLVVALGGGVVGDLAGFCAATYQRGMGWVGVPTTLLAQVDSAYGGKTGVDLPEAKNYVGAYHQPSAVLADPATLRTLPEAELAAGYAEVVKTALIAGGWLWERVRAGADPADPAVIAGCALTKLRVVARDERDGGLRQVLNLGHTVAHALEALTGYRRFRHGEAVSLGLLAALRLSGVEELRAEVRELLATRGLPVSLDGVDPDALAEATARDKKRLGTAPVPFVLLDAPGAARAGCAVDARALRAAVRELVRG